LFRQAAGRKSGDGPLGEMIGQPLSRTGDELRRLAAASGSADDGIAEAALLAFYEIQISEKELTRIRRRLARLVEDLTKGRPTRGARAQRRFRLTLAFYPLDRP
jgi:hypothetical protein